MASSTRSWTNWRRASPRPGVTDLKLHRPARYSRNSPTVYLLTLSRARTLASRCVFGATGHAHVRELAKWPDNPSLNRQSQLRDIRLLLYSTLGPITF